MASRTAYLAKLLGLYCIVFAVVMLARQETTIAAVRALMADPPLVLVSGIAALGIGLAIVLAHNVWSGGALPVVVTLVGWLSAMKGIVLLWLSPSAVLAYYDALHYDRYFVFYAVGTLVLGIYLTYAGARTGSGRGSM